ncbi:multiple inositol polyphosphate phosphatase 1 [Halyomorpha halys]|uniref:multiple inositol polyphosphate phosphatase 1 n=1 Tax=Halyomorpha halys TaxID=286706 RepID=UPI0006D51CBA|nr:multiple inositol polyphosphate phosphatase 1-like [Halyomorpha halys]
MANSFKLSVHSIYLFLTVVLLFINIVYTVDKTSKIESEVIFHLGTKTPYRIVANTNDSVVEYPGCYPVKIFGIIRHGTRTPGNKVINKVKQIISTVKLSSHTKDAFAFLEGILWKSQAKKKWSSLLNTGPEKILTTEGENEMMLLAHRFQNRFPSLLPKIFSNSSYFLKYTDTQRTKESARHFAIGLFGEEASDSVWFPKPPLQDPILRFYKLCDKWKKEVKKNPMTKYELNKYKTSPEVHNMQMQVSSRIGLNYTLSFETLHLIFTACAFETAWYPHNSSAWCSPFDKKDIEIMEYFEELKYFWRDGYGYDINYKQACPLLRKVTDFFMDKAGPKAIFYFTHSGALLKTLSHIGLYKDDFKLTHDTDLKLRQTRNWNVSKMNSFGNNLVFVLFRCEDGEKLLTLHQERPVILSGCPKEELCPFPATRKIMPASADYQCDFTRICSL